jgi:hypothetical protein
MTKATFAKSKAQFLQGALNLLTADVRLILVDTTVYTFDASHEFLSSVPSGARAAVSSSLTGKTIDAATAAFKSDEKVIGSVPAGSALQAIIGYVHTGADATARLLWYQDEGVTGLPVTPDGRDIKITPASGGWFKI